MQVVGVKFKQRDKITYFNPEKKLYNLGEGVICENQIGLMYGEISLTNTEISDDKLNLETPINPIIRIATMKDKLKVKANKQKAIESFIKANEIIKKFNLNMKLLEAEYTFDCQKLFLTFSSEERVDFRDLVKELANVFKVRIELRQVGLRDEVKIIGGIGPCGRATCCNTFLEETGKVGIKMAKLQNLSLSPTKLNGLCGKIMCCIAYENETYQEHIALLPKINTKVITKKGEGIVIYNNILEKKVTVKLNNDDGKYVEFPLEEIKKYDEPIE